jgi:hypothetical protein
MAPRCRRILKKRIAHIDRKLRERKLLVFQSEILKWAEKAIKDTEYAKYCMDNKPTIGWYEGWLKRMDFMTGVLRPLEQTKSE